MDSADWKKPNQLIKGAFLAAAAFTLQSASLYFPVIGASLSSLSTLPIALAGYLNINTGILAYIVTGLLLGLWSVPRALFFYCGAGILGLCLGILIKRRVPFFYLVCLSGITMAFGLICVSSFLNWPLLPWLQQDKRFLLIPVMLVWSTIYAAIWVPVLKAVIRRLRGYI
jgi:hypothetical protein